MLKLEQIIQNLLCFQKYTILNTNKSQYPLVVVIMENSLINLGQLELF